MDAQDVAASAIEPGEDDDLIPRPNSVEALQHIRLEDQPGLGCSLVALLGGRRRVGQVGLDRPDGYHLETRLVLCADPANRERGDGTRTRNPVLGRIPAPSAFHPAGMTRAGGATPILRSSLTADRARPVARADPTHGGDDDLRSVPYAADLPARLGRRPEAGRALRGPWGAGLPWPMACTCRPAYPGAGPGPSPSGPIADRSSPADGRTSATCAGWCDDVRPAWPGSMTSWSGRTSPRRTSWPRASGRRSALRFGCSPARRARRRALPLPRAGHRADPRPRRRYRPRRQAGRHGGPPSPPARSRGRMDAPLSPGARDPGEGRP